VHCATSGAQPLLARVAALRNLALTDEVFWSWSWNISFPWTVISGWPRLVRAPNAAPAGIVAGKSAQVSGRSGMQRGIGMICIGVNGGGPVSCG
jgi:hypothetical protein